MSIKMPYSGVFAPLCEEFIAQKRAVGYLYKEEDRELKYFDRFSRERGLREQVLSREIVEAWVEKRPHEAAKSREHRVTIIREFAKFLATRGHAAYILPPQRKKAASAFVPYIFTKAGIGKILDAADRMVERAISPYIHLIMPVLLRVLYGCGLRISEALALRVKDVDLEKGCFIVLDSKCDDNRIVPMSASLLNRCRAYMASIPILSDPDTPFFPNRRGGSMGTRGVYAQYRRFLWQAGISHGGRGHGPRLHDLRHTFAVHAMRQLIAAGREITTMPPILSTYLGHKCLASTETYLRLVADAYPETAQMFEKHFAGVMPRRLP
jgi:integrase